MFYDLDGDKGLVYQGHITTKKHSEKVPEKDSEADKVLDAIELMKVPDHLTRLNKPTIDEDDQLHFVVFGSMPAEPSCQFIETSYVQPHDSKLVPPYTAAKPVGQAAEEVRQAEQTLRGQQIVAETLDRYTQVLEAKAVKAKEEADQNPSSRTLKAGAEAAVQEATAARQLTQTALRKLADAKKYRDLKEAQFKEVKEEFERKSIVCDLDVREKGSTKIDYTLLKSPKAKDITGEDVLLKDSVLVHELYRYRILAGPVFSTLEKHNKNYELRQNSAGQSVITATAAQDSPPNFALLLKIYHTKRDVLDPPSLFSNRWCETFNPIIGINLFDKPLENFYAGFSFEPWGGFDIIGGVHWGKTQQLVDGFTQGQVVTQTNGLTKERFTNGWFVGVAADIGVITTLLKSAGSGLLTATKTTP